MSNNQDYMTPRPWTRSQSLTTINELHVPDSTSRAHALRIQQWPKIMVQLITPHQVSVYYRG